MLLTYRQLFYGIIWFAVMGLAGPFLHVILYEHDQPMHQGWATLWVVFAFLAGPRFIIPWLNAHVPILHRFAMWSIKK